MRVVIDTNVLMSGIFWAGYPGKILELWAEKQFKLLLSRQVFEEYKRIELRLSQKYSLPSANLVLHNVFLGSHLIEPGSVPVPHCDDPNDIMFLKLAVAGKANYLISGDDDLLRIKTYTGGEIIKPKTFVSLFS